jgi:hypothetical protein
MMMTKTTMRLVRSYCRWCCLVVCGDDFKYLQTRGPERERKMWLKNGQKGREKTFLICMFFWSRNGCCSQSQSRRFSRFLSLAGLVVWFSHVICWLKKTEKQIKVFPHQHSPDIHTLYTYSCFLSLSIFA